MAWNAPAKGLLKKLTSLHYKKIAKNDWKKRTKLVEQSPENGDTFQPLLLSTRSSGTTAQISFLP